MIDSALHSLVSLKTNSRNLCSPFWLHLTCFLNALEIITSPKKISVQISCFLNKFVSNFLCCSVKSSRLNLRLEDYVCCSESSSTIVFPSQPIPLAAYQIEFEDNGSVCTASLHGHCIWLATVGQKVLVVLTLSPLQWKNSYYRTFYGLILRFLVTFYILYKGDILLHWAPVLQFSVELHLDLTVDFTT